MYSHLARAAAVAAALLAAVPAFAGGEKKIAVSYADLNLVSAKGKQAFDRRITTAARRICDAAPQRDLAMQAADNRCVAAVLATTAPAIDLALRNAGNRQLAARDMSVIVAP
ncbi:UrcA family protein [Sphingomonas sp. LT1P40]|uniref:UrcA family protein n=1 Tax=Alteristakelama amylovorans TaxID=3096166 RepID=UPI002FC8AB89